MALKWLCALCKLSTSSSTSDNHSVGKTRRGSKMVTLGSSFKGQLTSLVATINSTTVHYVRCIKPNDAKRAGLFEADRVKHQVKYLGLLENVKVRRAGFAYRATYDRFLERFKLLSRDTYPKEWRGTDKDGAKAILRAARKRMPDLADMSP